MSNNNNQDIQNIDRRSLLKSVGIGGIALSGIPTFVSAEPDDDHVERLLAEPKVKSIRDAVGGIDVLDVEVNIVETDDLKLTGTWIETDVGTIVHGESDGGTREVKLDFADLSQNPDLRNRLPTDYRDVPRESHVTLFGRESGVIMTRSVTDEEQRRLRQAVPDPGENFNAAYSSDIDGYRVFTGNSPSDTRTYQVGADGKGISQQHVEEVVMAQGCLEWCLSCASWAASKGICYWSCALAVTLAGAILCILCIANTNLSLIWVFDDCADCYDNCV